MSIMWGKVVKLSAYIDAAMEGDVQQGPKAFARNRVVAEIGGEMADQGICFHSQWRGGCQSICLHCRWNLLLEAPSYMLTLALA